VLNNDGTLNRSKLGDLIFHDENQRKLLNIITHPYIQRAMIWQILKHFLKGEQFVVVVSPLLYESNRFLRYMKKIIVVSCSKEQQLMRLMNRDNLTESDALTRIQSQMPLEEKCKRSDYVIDNTDEMEFTRQQTFNLYFNMKRISRLCGLHRWLMVVTIVIGFIALKFIVL
jgi:dephospho-CoA kinase